MGARMTMNRWAQYSDDVKAKADAITELYAAAIVDSAQQKAPYRFGHLEASIEQASDGATLARRRIVVGQFYGIYQEKGTHSKTTGEQIVPPHPYLVPAVDQYREDYKAAIRMVV